MRRSLAAVPLAALVLSATTACGDDGGDGSATTASDAIEGLTITGKFGDEPKVEVDGLDVSKTETGTIISGDGAELTKDDSIRFRFYAANGTDGKKLASNFADQQPSTIDLSDAGPVKVITESLIGTQIGDRVAVVAPISDMVGKGQTAPPGMTKKEDIVYIFDVLEAVAPPLEGPEGTPADPQAGAPTVVEEDGAVTGIDFTDAPAKPPKKLDVIPVIDGEGAEVKEGDQLTVDYFGVVWGGTEPFDQSYSGGEPASFSLAQGALIDGWVEGLQGVKVGSRVMLVVPPDKGYGKEGQPPTIPGNATLVFVIDVLGANL